MYVASVSHIHIHCTRSKSAQWYWCTHIHTLSHTLLSTHAQTTKIRTLQGILCNSQCPDELRLGELTSNNWHTGVKIFIAVLIAGLAALTVLGKIVFCLWLLRLEKKQRDYLKSLKPERNTQDNNTLQVKWINYYICLWLSPVLWLSRVLMDFVSDLASYHYTVAYIN